MEGGGVKAHGVRLGTLLRCMHVLRFERASNRSTAVVAGGGTSSQTKVFWIFRPNEWRGLSTFGMSVRQPRRVAIVPLF